MDVAAVLAFLQAQADLGDQAAVIATRYLTGALTREQLAQEWSAFRIQRAQAERLWAEAAGAPGIWEG